MSITNAIHRRTIIIPLLVLLSLSLSGSIAASQSAQEEDSSSLAVTGNNDYATCTDSSDTLVVCDLKIVAGQSSLDLISDVMLLANQINSAINTDTVMWIHAYGGGGGRGSNEGPWKAGDGGSGGYASTITTINDYQARYGTTTLHYYFGGCCNNFATDWEQGGGGASTIVASVASGITADNVLLIAGGGGGSSGGANLASGQDGGNGGHAIATTANATYHAGQDVKGDNNKIARGGSYTGPGIGSPSTNPSGLGRGGDGFGGWGGGSVEYGLDTRTSWLNGDPGVGDAGHGMNNSPNTPAAGGGGGYGGGGINACGYDIHHDCAAAGAGSYATGITRYDSWQPTSWKGGNYQAAVHIAFHLEPGGTFAFAEPVTNPFGLSTTGLPAIPTFVDIDGNGTQDLFVSGFHSAGSSAPAWFYFKNTGTPSEPTFTASSFDLPEPMIAPGAMSFVDLDDDGDFDFFYNSWYFENTGSATNPQFATDFIDGVNEPFGITALDNIWSQTFADIDSDGDYDAFAGTTDGHVHYYQNVGSATKPAFAAPVDSPFGIEPVYGNAVPAFVDNNSDGNLDVIVGSVSGSVGYRQNLGSPQNPAFGDQQVNPFGLTKLTGSSSPAIVDINDDGQPDVFFGNGSTYKLLVQLNDAPFVPPYGDTSAALAGVEAEVASDPVPRYEAEPDAMIALSHDSTMQTATIYGSESFDASRVSRDVIAFEDWSGTELATIVHAFWGAAIGDVNGDGYLDQTLIFHSDDPAMIADEVYHGKELCVRGVTVDGVSYEACNFAEE